jgi:hypothetical protein
MIDDDRDLRVRQYRHHHVRGALADRTGPLSLRSDDLVLSDCGEWPPAGDIVASVCAGCGRRSRIARELLCWSCWPREYYRRLAAEPASDPERNGRSD